MQGRDRKAVRVSKVGDGGGTGGSSGVAGREGGGEINCPAEDCMAFWADECTAESWVRVSLDELVLTRSSVGLVCSFCNSIFLMSRREQGRQLTAAGIGREVSLTWAFWFLLARKDKNLKVCNTDHGFSWRLLLGTGYSRRILLLWAVEGDGRAEVSIECGCGENGFIRVRNEEGETLLFWLFQLTI